MIRKILLVSDSHGKSQNIKTAIDKEHPDMLIHLGDIEDDPEMVRRWLDEAAPQSRPVPAVFIKGNCDRYYAGDSDSQKGGLKGTAVFNLNDHRFYCTHGHKQGVSYGLESLMYNALENDCDIAIYGHTHIPFDELFEGFAEAGTGVRILNPGSISLPRGGNKKSYMIMTFDDNNDYTVELKYI